MLLGVVFSASANAAPPEIIKYAKMCNASAAIAVGDGLVVVADDEDSCPTPLRLYRIKVGGDPRSKTVIPFGILDLDLDEDGEVDIEGAAQIGEFVYWIGSHSASSDGEKRPNRRRLFATKLQIGSDSELEIKQVGKAYKHLVADLIDDNRFDAFELRDAAKRDPKEDDALSIEGLAATKDDDLLIGFRTPIINGKALVVKLTNPKKVIEGKNAHFDDPIELDLDGRGIRSIERRKQDNTFVIVAGSHDGTSNFKLFTWSGDENAAPKAISNVDLGDLNPEALFFEGDKTFLLSDDGKHPKDGPHCENAPRKERQFRGIEIKLE